MGSPRGSDPKAAYFDYPQRQRFMAPGTDPADGYAWFLGRQLKDQDVVIVVAEQGGEVIGYVYAGLEPISWKELRDACGFIHDVVVDERGRRGGVATALIKKAVEWLRERGARDAVGGGEERRRAAALHEAGLPPHDDRDDERVVSAGRSLRGELFGGGVSVVVITESIR